MYDRRVDQDLQSHEAQGFEIYEERGERDGEMGDGEREERDGEMEEGDEELVEHRSLRQQSSGELSVSEGVCECVSEGVCECVLSNGHCTGRGWLCGGASCG